MLSVVDQSGHTAIPLAHFSVVVVDSTNNNNNTARVLRNFFYPVKPRNLPTVLVLQGAAALCARNYFAPGCTRQRYIQYGAKSCAKYMYGTEFWAVCFLGQYIEPLKKLCREAPHFSGLLFDYFTTVCCKQESSSTRAAMGAL